MKLFRERLLVRLIEDGAVTRAYPVALADNYRSNGMDPERADNMARMGDVDKAGISHSLHSDMPTAPGQPQLLMCSVELLGRHLHHDAEARVVPVRQK